MATQRLQDAVGLHQHLSIRESDDVKAERAELLVAPRVSLHVFCVPMLLTVDLDDEAVSETAEIDDETCDRVLSSKLRPELPILDAAPEQPLGVGLVAAKIPSALRRRHEVERVHS